MTKKKLGLVWFDENVFESRDITNRISTIQIKESRENLGQNTSRNVLVKEEIFPVPNNLDIKLI